MISDFLIVPYLVGRAGGVALRRFRVASEMRRLIDLRGEKFSFRLPRLGIAIVWNPLLRDHHFIAWLRQLLVDVRRP